MTDVKSAHSITIEPFAGCVSVRFDGVLVAETTKALALTEGEFPVVYYLPAADVRVEHTRPSDHKTHCPFKGDASYRHLVVGDERADNAIWTYLDPIDAVAAIRDHVAFYRDKVTIEAIPSQSAP